MRQEELFGKTVEELYSIKNEIRKALDAVSDAAMLADSVPGKKLVERMTKDLDAVRKKYAGISSADSVSTTLASLHFLQGRERQLMDELGVLTEAEKKKKELTEHLAVVESQVAVERQRHEGR
jgi:predicted  nucleic acid-binding Zn-ribbon protein